MRSIVNELREEKLSILKLFILSYKAIFTNIIMLVITALMLVVMYFIPIEFILLLDPISYLMVVIVLEYTFFKKTNYNIKRVALFLVIILLFEYILFQYLILIVPLLLLLRNLDFSSSLLLSFKLIRDNIAKIFLTNFMQLIFLGIIIGFPLAFYTTELNLIPVGANQEQVYEILIKFTTPYLPFFKIISSIIFGVQNYLIYKHVEYKDIIRG
ncbi:hypothetical protein [Oceanivirga salmonicida]|uniref:hypothetical protein n=1 Tax=Oceanivirga salmonicida TaxID=1769291 RepID=UPI00082F3924|nr:hypothetical protein [Oceanivirga salmonicida]